MTGIWTTLKQLNREIATKLEEICFMAYKEPDKYENLIQDWNAQGSLQAIKPSVIASSPFPVLSYVLRKACQGDDDKTPRPLQPGSSKAS